MLFIELFIIALGLGMDSFSVSICKGLTLKNIEVKTYIKIGLAFGIFQGLMPVIGFLLGQTFKDIISNVDHWLAFILLGIIGINMIREAFEKGEKEEVDDKLDFKNLSILGIATSIDALILGITFAIMNVNIIIASLVIIVVTFIMSIIGVRIGNICGCKFEKKAEILGGIILILIGLKILLEHLNIIS